MMRSPYLKFLLFLWIVTGGCTVSESYDVSESLLLAGENRSELRQVLEHYRGDGEKYRAACFLIANMKYHRSNVAIVVSTEYRTFFEKADSHTQAIFRSHDADSIFRSKAFDVLRKQLASDFQKMPPPVSSNGKPDLQTVTAHDLIDDIDRAFEIWKKSPYAATLDFADFLEMILPYRTADETLPEGKKRLSDLFYERLYSGPHAEVSARIASFKDYVKKIRWLTSYVPVACHMGPYDLFTPKFKNDCHNMAAWTCDIFRACGIPAVYEFTPMWTDRTKRHFWCAVPDSLGIMRPFTPPNNNMMEDWNSDLKYAGKVYRKTFGVNRSTPCFLGNGKEYLPWELASALLSDQTYRYHQTVTLTVPFEERTENNLVYLCFFANNEDGLSPVAWGTIDRSKRTATFRQVPLNIVFFPAYYTNDRLTPFGDAFMLKTEGLLDWLPEPHSLSMTDAYEEPHLTLAAGHELRFSHTGRRVTDITCHAFKPLGMAASMKLLRKYPEKRTLKEMAMRLPGALVLGSQQERGPYDTLCILSEVPKPHLQDAAFENRRKYRFYRFATKDRGPINIAHAEFLGRYSAVHECTAPTDLPDFGTGRDSVHEALYRIVGTPIRTGSRPYHAFDGNMLTYCGASSLGMDFGTPVCITRMRFAPRNADNMIRAGDTYTLYYYDCGWRYHSTTVASANYLLLEHVPAGTIYWLVNETHGREELPFTYSDGRQKFINLS